MHDGRKISRFQTSQFFTGEPLVQSRPAVPNPRRFRHVLVSTGLTIADRNALLLGFELASLHQSTLTLLHVLPLPKEDRAHGLDAVSLLHVAADKLRGTSTALIDRKLPPPPLRKFVDDTVPRELLDLVAWRGVRREGDLAESVVSFARDFAADLVILPVQPFRWWLPVVPFAVWTIQRRAQASVIVIRAQVPSPWSRKPSWQALVSHLAAR
jgi:hypothetical protein